MQKTKDHTTVLLRVRVHRTSVPWYVRRCTKVTLHVSSLKMSAACAMAVVGNPVPKEFHAMYGQANSSTTPFSDELDERVEEYRKAAWNARLRAYAYLDAAGLEPGDVDALANAIEAGGVAHALSDVERVPLTGAEAGWIAVVRERLVRMADELCQRHGPGASASWLQAGKLASEGVGELELERLRGFVRQALGQSRPHTMEWRRAAEALGESGWLCTASTIEHSAGRVLWCTREAGHYDPEVEPEGDDPGGWHLCNSRLWTDDRPSSYPHAAV